MLRGTSPKSLNIHVFMAGKIPWVGSKKIDCHHDNQSKLTLKSNTMKNSFHLYNTVYQCWFNRIRKFFKFFSQRPAGVG